MNTSQSSIHDHDANQSMAPKPEQNRMISTTATAASNIEFQADGPSPLPRRNSDEPSCSLASSGAAPNPKRCAQPQKMPSIHALASARQSRAVRLHLSLLVRVLFQYLERQDGEILILARAVLKDCERKHSLRESKYDSLADAIYNRLRGTVGETHWHRAREIQRRLVIKQSRKKTMRHSWDSRKQKRL